MKKAARNLNLWSRNKIDLCAKRNNSTWASTPPIINSFLEFKRSFAVCATADVQLSYTYLVWSATKAFSPRGRRKRHKLMVSTVDLNRKRRDSDLLVPQ